MRRLKVGSHYRVRAFSIFSKKVKINANLFHRLLSFSISIVWLIPPPPFSWPMVFGIIDSFDWFFPVEDGDIYVCRNLQVLGHEWVWRSCTSARRSMELFRGCSFSPTGCSLASLCSARPMEHFFLTTSGQIGPLAWQVKLTAISFCSYSGDHDGRPK